MIIGKTYLNFELEFKKCCIRTSAVCSTFIWSCTIHWLALF